MFRHLAHPKVRFDGLHKNLSSRVVAESESDDLVQYLVVAEATVGCGVREILVFGNLRVWICFQKVELTVRRKAVIQTRIAAQAEVPVDSLR
jgi:hypothetical protein